MALAILLAGTIISFILFWRGSLKKRRAEVHAARVEALFIATLDSIAADRQDDVRDVVVQFSRIEPRKAEILRQAEIVFESLRIARQSADPSTAQSRIELANRLWGEMGLPLRGLVSSQFFDEVKARFETRIRSAHTGTVLRQLQELISRAIKLKTDKARKRYIEQINALLDDALKNPLADRSVLEELRGKLQLDALDLTALSPSA